MYTEDEYKQTMNDAVKYLSDKYGEEFVLDSYEIGDILSDTDIIRCLSSNMNKENEYIEVIVNPDSPKGFSDNYFGYLIRPAMEEEIGIAMGINECKIFREDIEYCLPDSLVPGNTVEDFYNEMPDYWMTVNIFIPNDSKMTESDYNQMTKRFEQWMISKKRYYTVHLFVVSNEWYNKIDRYNMNDFWQFFAENNSPDYLNLYYVYTKMIMSGGAS